MVRVAFLRKIGRRRVDSCGVKIAMRTAFEGTAGNWYLPEVLILRRFMSSHVGFGIAIRVSMISRSAAMSFKVKGNQNKVKTADK